MRFADLRNRLFQQASAASLTEISMAPFAILIKQADQSNFAVQTDREIGGYWIQAGIMACVACRTRRPGRIGWFAEIMHDPVHGPHVSGMASKSSFHIARANT